MIFFLFLSHCSNWKHLISSGHRNAASAFFFAFTSLTSEKDDQAGLMSSDLSVSFPLPPCPSFLLLLALFLALSLCRPVSKAPDGLASSWKGKCSSVGQELCCGLVLGWSPGSPFRIGTCALLSCTLPREQGCKPQLPLGPDHILQSDFTSNKLDVNFNSHMNLVPTCQWFPDRGQSEQASEECSTNTKTNGRTFKSWLLQVSGVVRTEGRCLGLKKTTNPY